MLRRTATSLAAISQTARGTWIPGHYTIGPHLMMKDSKERCNFPISNGAPSSRSSSSSSASGSKGIMHGVKTTAANTMLQAFLSGL
jgi:hypothetical protein